MPHELLLPIVREHLGQYHIEHKTVECDASLADTAAFCEHYGFTPEQSANTILVVNRRDPQQLVACVLLADSRLDVNKKVCELMGTKRASFAPADITKNVTGMEIGGVTIFGLPEHVPIYVDARVMQQPEVIMGGGNRTSKIVLDPQELTKMPQMTVVEALAKHST